MIIPLILVFLILRAVSRPDRPAYRRAGRLPAYRRAVPRPAATSARPAYRPDTKQQARREKLLWNARTYRADIAHYELLALSLAELAQSAEEEVYAAKSPKQRRAAELRVVQAQNRAYNAARRLHVAQGRLACVQAELASLR